MKYYVGFDLGGANNRVVIADENGDFVTKILGEANDRKNGPVGISQQMTKILEKCATKNNISLDDIVGVGISSAGPLDLESFGGSIRDSTNIKFPIDLDLDNLPAEYKYRDQKLLQEDSSGRHLYIPLVNPIKDFLKEKTGKDIPVYLGNDVNTAVIGVVKFGEGKKDDSAKMNYTVVATTHGAGFGAGVWTRGGVMEGQDGNAAECGHFIYKREGRKCGCPNSGCAEAYGSGTGVRENAKELIAVNGYKSEIYDRAVQKAKKAGINERKIKADPSKPLEFIDSKLVFEVFQTADDEIADKVVGEAIEAIGLAYADIAKAYNPKMIVTFGGITNNWGSLKYGIKNVMEAKLNVRAPKLKRTKLGDNVGIHGAVGRAMGYGR